MYLKNKISSCRRPVIAGLLVCLAGNAGAQLKQTYSHAVLQLKNRESINGYLRDDETRKLNYGISFKANLNDKPHLYTAAEVLAVHTDANTVYEQIHFRPDGDSTTVTALGHLLADGKAKLYEVNFADAPMYVIVNNGTAYPLQKDKPANGNANDELHHYQNYLNAALDGAPAAAGSLDEIPYTTASFIKQVVTYNQQQGNSIQLPPKPIRTPFVSFLVAGAGGVIKNGYENEMTGSISWRLYNPHISRTTALNIGVSFFRYRHLENYKINVRQTFTTLLYSMPMTVQQFFSPGRLRPYVFIGLNFSIIHTADDFGVRYNDRDFNRNYGLSMAGGAGIEWSVYKGLMIKGEWRFENYRHLIMPGIAYAIPLKK